MIIYYLYYRGLILQNCPINVLYERKQLYIYFQFYIQLCRTNLVETSDRSWSFMKKITHENQKIIVGISRWIQWNSLPKTYAQYGHAYLICSKSHNIITFPTFPNLNISGWNQCLLINTLIQLYDLFFAIYLLNLDTGYKLQTMCLACVSINCLCLNILLKIGDISVCVIASIYITLKATFSVFFVKFLNISFELNFSAFFSKWAIWKSKCEIKLNTLFLEILERNILKYMIHLSRYSAR